MLILFILFELFCILFLWLINKLDGKSNGGFQMERHELDSEYVQYEIREVINDNEEEEENDQKQKYIFRLILRIFIF